VTRASGSFISR